MVKKNLMIEIMSSENSERGEKEEGDEMDEEDREIEEGDKVYMLSIPD
jgi:hypothetical protein